MLEMTLLFGDDSPVRVPRLYSEYCTRRLLVQERFEGFTVAEIRALDAAGIDRKALAEELLRSTLDQILRIGLFHADPHPGNIFVTPLGAGGGAGGAESAGRAWKFTFVDFGMMGEVSDDLRHGLRKLLIAAASRDGKGMVDGIREVGGLLPSAETAELERAMTKLFARFGGMGFAELQKVEPREFRAFAVEFGDVVRSLPFQLPENFFLIVRAMSLTSGMCSSLDPAFNIWNAVEPYSAQLIRAEGGNLMMDVARQAWTIAAVIARLPQRLDDLTTRIEEGTISARSPRLERRVSSLERTGRRVISAVLFAALLVGGILLRVEDVVFGTVLMALSALPLLHAVFAAVVGRRGPLR
jgi:predicted unusual protein kinase regulating ubiquinone biosynthesis (AarF/ABC1/UbiB family)